MAYNGHRGRCVGRIMQFLYTYDSQFDYFAGIGGGAVMDNRGDGNTKLADITWEEDTDYPVFTFYGPNAEHWTAQQTRLRQQVMTKDEQFVGLFGDHQPDDHFVITRNVGWLKRSYITHSRAKHEGSDRPLSMEIPSVHVDYQIDERMQFFSRYPRDLPILEDGEVKFTVKDMMVRRYIESLDGQRL